MFARRIRRPPQACGRRLTSSGKVQNAASKLVSSGTNTATIVSSGLVASAVAADLVQKCRRNRQWEETLSQSKATVEETSILQQERLMRLAEERKLLLRLFSDSSDTPETRLHAEKPPGKQRRKSWRDRLQEADEALLQRREAGFAEWPGIPFTALRGMTPVELENLLRDENVLRAIHGGTACTSLEDLPVSYPQSIKRTITMEWSVLRLVLDLLAESSPDSTQMGTMRTFMHSRTSGEWRKIARAVGRQMAELQKGNDIQTRPQHPRFASVASQSERLRRVAQANKSLQSSLQDMNTPITAVCARLLLRDYEPDVNMFNLLLQRFCTQKENRMVQLLRKSMENCNIRPNEYTHATLLRFYTSQGDADAFHAYALKLQGSNFGIARGHNSSPKHHPLLLARYRLGRGGNVVVEKARLDGSVYSELIQGLLRFSRRCDAKRFFRKMIDNGWQPPAELLTAILADCARIPDLGSGLALWDRIRNMGQVVTQYAYGLIIQLCLSSGELQRCSNIIRSGIERGELRKDGPWTELCGARINIIPANATVCEASLILKRLVTPHSQMKLVLRQKCRTDLDAKSRSPAPLSRSAVRFKASTTRQSYQDPYSQILHFDPLSIFETQDLALAG